MTSNLRIVSLLPSATEILWSLGVEDNIVGISHSCDFPESILGLDILTSARVNFNVSSVQIDHAVKGVVQNALSIYDVDIDALKRLEPDIIVTQDLCDVCAVSLDDVRKAVLCLGPKSDITIVSLQAMTLENVFSDIEKVGRVLGLTEYGYVVRNALEKRVENISIRAKNAAYKPKVLSLEWIEPLMLGGTWMPDLIYYAGGMPCGIQDSGEPAQYISAEAVSDLSPDVIVIKPCGFSMERTLEEISIIEEAVIAKNPSARVYITDGKAFFNRPGPRLVESLEIMASCVHPSLFSDFAEKHTNIITSIGA